MKQKVYICENENSLPDLLGENIFQQQAMFRFYNSLQNYKPFVVLLEEDQKIKASLLGVIIKQKKHLPACLVSRCLIIGEAQFYEKEVNKKVVYNMFLDKIDSSFGKKCLFIEFRHFDFDKNISDTFLNKGYLYQAWYNVVNHLNNIHISSSKKRQIQSGLRNGAKIIEGTSEKQIKEFYLILKKLYAEIKKPLPQLEFFIRFLSDFCQQGKGVYLLVEHEGKIIGGIMCVIQANETIYEWYTGALKKENKHLYPGVLSTYAAIEYAEKKGFQYFDFMGAGQQNKAYGVRNFKLKFGGELKETCRYRKKNYPILYKIAMLLSKKF